MYFFTSVRPSSKVSLVLDCLFTWHPYATPMQNLSLEKTRNLLLTGADQSDRMKYATSLVMALLCRTKNACGHCLHCTRVQSRRHPNLIIIEPERSDQDEAFKDSEYQGDIKIDQIRRLNEESHKANFEDGKMVFIITHMHQITKAAANALLKSLEESSENKVFLALAPSRFSVLPTIASRLIVQAIKPSLLLSESSAKAISDIHTITATCPEERFALCKKFPGERALLIPELLRLQDSCHQLLRAFHDDKDPHHPGLRPQVALKIADALSHALEYCAKNANPMLVIEYMLFHQWPYA